MDTPNDWAHFYPSTTSESTVVSTGPGLTQPSHNIEGRVGKSARRRTRASRRAPTTLLNTDPTNFRAMVQQFTGAPTGPYTDPARPVISFGFRGDQMQQQSPGMPLGQYGQYHGQQYDGAVIVPGGNVSDGFVQGFNSSASNASSTTSGFFLDGMMGGNNGRGGYFL